MNENQNQKPSGTSTNSLLKTKPTWAETVATDKGWEDSKTGELLVAIKGLNAKLTPAKRGRGRPRKNSQ